MIANAVLVNAAVSVVSDYLKGVRLGAAPDNAELSPDVLKALEAQLDALRNAESSGIVALSREAARPEAEAETPTVSRDVGAAALTISPADVFKAARSQNKQVFLIGLVLTVVLAIILVIGVGGVIVTAVFLGKGSGAAVFGGVSLLDVVGFILTKPLAVIQGASVTSQRLDLLHLHLQQQLNACSDYETVQERFEFNSKVWDKTQEEFGKLAAA